jgi:hypothetical protein
MEKPKELPKKMIGRTLAQMVQSIVGDQRSVRGPIGRRKRHIPAFRLRTSAHYEPVTGAPLSASKVTREKTAFLHPTKGWKIDRFATKVDIGKPRSIFKQDMTEVERNIIRHFAIATAPIVAVITRVVANPRDAELNIRSRFMRNRLSRRAVA